VRERCILLMHLWRRRQWENQIARYLSGDEGASSPGSNIEHCDRRDGGGGGGEGLGE